MTVSVVFFSIVCFVFMQIVFLCWWQLISVVSWRRKQSRVQGRIERENQIGDEVNRWWEHEG